MNASAYKASPIELPSGRLHLYEWGSPDAPAALFFHKQAPLASGAQMLEVAPILVEALGFRVLAPDAPGFGRSSAWPAERYGMPNLVALGRELITARNVEGPLVIGHSWGGFWAIHLTLALAPRVRGLVLANGGYFDDRDVPSLARSKPLGGWIAAISSGEPAIRAADWAEFDPAARALNQATRYNDAIRDVLRAGAHSVDGRIVAASDPAARAGAIFGMTQSFATEPVAALAATTVPVLAVGAGQPAAVAETSRLALTRLRKTVPSATISYQPDWSHDVFADGGPALAEIIVDWVRRLNI